MTKDEVLKVHSGVFYAALTSQNYAALEELYSDDYMLVRPDGSVLNKQEVLQDLRSNGLRFHSIHRRLFARGRFDPACSFSKYHSRQVSPRYLCCRTLET